MIRVVYDDHMGDCIKPARMARGSMGRTTRLNDDGSMKESDRRLLTMLARGMGQDEYEDLQSAIVRAAEYPDYTELERLIWKFRHNPAHTAPFGHNFLTVHFEAPVFVMRQIVKHKFLRLSEMSMRYVRGMPEYYKPESWRSVAEDVKQGSGEDVSDWLQSDMNSGFNLAYINDETLYDEMIADGICAEQARIMLRLCHMTQGYMSGSMDAWANLVIQRLDPHAQYETQLFARQVDSICEEIWPISWTALTEGVAR